MRLRLLVVGLLVLVPGLDARAGIFRRRAAAVPCAGEPPPAHGTAERTPTAPVRVPVPVAGPPVPAAPIYPPATGGCPGGVCPVPRR